MKKTTVVFDLDGTLLDTLQDLANAVNYALEQQGMPKRTLEEVRQFVGNGVRLLMIRAVPDGESNPLFEETFALFKEYYGKHCNDNTKPYAGVVELIETLKEKGYAVAIVSNKIDFAVKELNDLYFKGIVPVAIGEKEGIRRKPPVRRALLPPVPRRRRLAARPRARPLRRRVQRSDHHGGYGSPEGCPA